MKKWLYTNQAWERSNENVVRWWISKTSMWDVEYFRRRGNEMNKGLWTVAISIRQERFGCQN